MPSADWCTEDFRHRPALVRCPSRASRTWRRHRGALTVIAIMAGLSSPLLYLAGRHLVQWGWGI